MNTIVLFAERGGWNPDAWIAGLNGTVGINRHYVIETPASWLSIFQQDDIFKDYDKEEEELVRSLIRDPSPYLIEWKGDDLLQKFVEDFPADKNAVIDNDHGLICVISKLKGKPVSSWVRTANGSE